VTHAKLKEPTGMADWARLLLLRFLVGLIYYEQPRDVLLSRVPKC